MEGIVSDFTSPSIWRSYFYGPFQGELAAEINRRQTLHAGCQHTRAPQARRLMFSGLSDDAQRFPFLWSWYALTLLDQAIFAHFGEAESTWHAATGGYPLPMVEVGFGCLHVAEPRALLTAAANAGAPAHTSNEWTAFTDFLVDEISTTLEQKSGVTPARFWTAVRTDPGFGTLDAGYEQALMTRAEVVLHQ